MHRARDLLSCGIGGLMNLKLILKTLFVIAVLGLLVLMGMHNKGTVELYMPPVLPSKLSQPAAIMYFGFFGIGFLSGTILMAGGKSGGGGSSKSSK